MITPADINVAPHSQPDEESGILVHGVLASVTIDGEEHGVFLRQDPDYYGSNKYGSLMSSVSESRLIYCAVARLIVGLREQGLIELTDYEEEQIANYEQEVAEGKAV